MSNLDIDGQIKTHFIRLGYLVATMAFREPEPSKFDLIRKKLVSTLTNLEMLLPSFWAKISTHLLLHVWEKTGTLMLCGPPQSSWMFANERIQGTLVRSIKQFKNPDVALLNHFQESAAITERRLLRGAPGYDTKRSTWVRKGVMANPFAPPPKHSRSVVVHLEGEPAYGYDLLLA